MSVCLGQSFGVDLWLLLPLYPHFPFLPFFLSDYKCCIQAALVSPWAWELLGGSGTLSWGRCAWTPFVPKPLGKLNQFSRLEIWWSMNRSGSEINWIQPAWLESRRWNGCNSRDWALGGLHPAWLSKNLQAHISQRRGGEQDTISQCSWSRASVPGVVLGLAKVNSIWRLLGIVSLCLNLKYGEAHSFWRHLCPWCLQGQLERWKEHPCPSSFTSDRTPERMERSLSICLRKDGADS